MRTIYNNGYLILASLFCAGVLVGILFPALLPGVALVFVLAMGCFLTFILCLTPPGEPILEKILISLCVCAVGYGVLIYLPYAALGFGVGMLYMILTDKFSLDAVR